MSNRQRDYDSTVARIAGNLLSSNPYLFSDPDDDRRFVEKAVAVARMIVKQTKASEPQLPVQEDF